MTPAADRPDAESVAHALEEASRHVQSIAAVLGEQLGSLESLPSRVPAGDMFQPLSRARSTCDELLSALGVVAQLWEASTDPATRRPGLAAGVPEVAARRALLSGAKSLTAAGRLEGVFSEFRAGLGKYNGTPVLCAARVICDPIDASLRLAVFRRSDNSFIAQSLPVRLVHLDTKSYADTSDWTAGGLL